MFLASQHVRSYLSFTLLVSVPVMIMGIGAVPARASQVDSMRESPPEHKFLYLHDGWAPKQSGDVQRYRDLGSDLTKIIGTLSAYPQITRSIQIFVNEFDCLDLADKNLSEAAVELCKEGTARHPTSPTGWNNLGWAYQKSGNYGEAIAAYSKAIEISPKYSKPLVNRHEIYKNIGDFEKAAADLETLGKYYPDSYLYLMNKCALYGEFKKLNEAETACRRASELHGITAISENNLGWIFLQSGEYNKAITQFTSAIKLDPRYTTPLINRSNAYAYQLKLNSSLDDLAAASQISGIRPDGDDEFSALFEIIFTVLEKKDPAAREEMAETVIILLEMAQAANDGKLDEVENLVAQLRHVNTQVHSALARSTNKLLDQSLQDKKLNVSDSTKLISVKAPPRDRVLCFLERRQSEFSNYYHDLELQPETVTKSATKFSDPVAESILLELKTEILGILDASAMEKMADVHFALLPTSDINAEIIRVPINVAGCENETKFDSRIVVLNSRLFRFMHNAFNASFPFFAFTYPPFVGSLPKGSVPEDFAQRLVNDVRPTIRSHTEEFLLYKAQASLPVRVHREFIPYQATLLRGTELFILAHEITHVLADDNPSGRTSLAILEQEIRADFWAYQKIDRIAYTSRLHNAGASAISASSVLLAAPIVLMKQLDVLRLAKNAIQGSEGKKSISSDVARSIASALVNGNSISDILVAQNHDATHFTELSRILILKEVMDLKQASLSKNSEYYQIYESARHLAAAYNSFIDLVIDQIASDLRTERRLKIIKAAIERNLQRQ